jgi:hypothetical protein
MQEQKFVILSQDVYETVVRYLINTQLYKDVATLVPQMTSDANKNSTRFALVENKPVVAPVESVPEVNTENE